MTATISNIGNEIEEIISKNRSYKPQISEEALMNKFLDSINKLRNYLIDRSEKINELDELFSKLTWLDVQDESEEVLLSNLITKAKKYHSKLIRNYAEIKKSIGLKGICKEEIQNYKSSIDDFEDSIFEVEQIFFVLRKDDEFNNLVNL